MSADVGIGIVVSATGSYWVTEMFVQLPTSALAKPQPTKQPQAESAPARVAEVATGPARQNLGDVRERSPLEHGHVFGHPGGPEARHHRTGGAPGVVEPAPALLAERYERLAKQQGQSTLGRLVDGHEVADHVDQRRTLGVLGMAAGQEVGRVHVRLTAELADPHRDAVGMVLFLAGMLEELLRH